MKTVLQLIGAVMLLFILAKAIEIVEALGNGSQPTASRGQSRSPGATANRPPGAPPTEGVAPITETGVIALDRNFYVVLDGSGSMGERSCAGQFPNRLEGAKWAVKQFTEKSVPSDVNLGLYAFDNAGSSERVPLGKDNRPNITREVDRVRGGGNTPLNAAIRASVTELVAQRERQLGYGEFYIVVATDGEATDGELASNGVRFASDNSIPIITIGFCLPREHPLARGSISYRNANSPEELLTALRETQGESPYFDQSVFRRN